MKLNELFNQKPVLAEDNIFIGDQSFSDQKISFDPAHTKAVGTFNRITIWGSKCLGERYDIYGILENDSPLKILAYCVFDIKSRSGYSQFIRAFVEQPARGRGLALTIMNYVITKAREKVIIDKAESTSSSSRKMLSSWFKMDSQKRHFDMRFMLNDKEIKDPNVDDILRPGSKNEVEIVLESDRDASTRMFGFGERVLHEFVWYDYKIGID